MPTQEERNQEILIHGLMNDVVGSDIQISAEDLGNTIQEILKQYNLSTDLSFIERVAKLKFPDKDDNLSWEEIPKELQDAAFLPVTTIADIALRQDIDMVVSQIPEWYNALIVTRDAICEADVVDGKLARNIVFDKTKLTDLEQQNVISKIENLEEKYGLHKLIKNHIVYNTLMYGEGYLYIIPYAKVFEDLYKYRLNSSSKNNGRNSVANMFDTSSALRGYGYGESAVEKTLKDVIVQESTEPTSKKDKGAGGKKPKPNAIFTEAEIMDIIPGYHAKQSDQKNAKADQKRDAEFDQYSEYVARNVRYIGDDIALPVIEESAHDLRAVYDVKYGDTNPGYVQEAHDVFERVMESGGSNIYTAQLDNEFKGIKGVYMKILPATKMIPIRIDRTVVGYYYISDLTRPDQTGDRRNSGLSGYTLRSPSVEFDTFSPDRAFCEKLASKIISNFDLKFMRDNTALHQQIVAILEAHKFNESMMRFIFIPAEHVCQCTINEDGAGKGHSMLEGGLINARMYMFLKLYSILFQINNSGVRVYNLHSSGIDKNYKAAVQEIMRKFAARRISVNDIFNYRNSVTKVSGGSELVMPVGPDGKPPLTFETINASEAPINTDLLDNQRAEALNSTPVPAIMVQNGGVTEIEFSKETELANTRFDSFVSSTKLDMNPDITKIYKKLAIWDSDIDPEIIHDLKFMFRMATSKKMGITANKLNDFEKLADVAVSIFLTQKEQTDAKGNKEDMNNVVREFKKQLLGKYVPDLDIEDMEKMANAARNEANKKTLNDANTKENMLNDAESEEV